MTAFSVRRQWVGLVTGGALAVSALGAAATAHAMTLVEAVTFAVTTNPEIGEARANRLAIDQELVQARGLYLPQIDLEARTGPEWSDTPTTRARGAGGDGDWQLPWQLSVVLQQRLFDGFEVDSEVERQAARVDAAAFRVIERSEFIGLDVVQAYLDVLRQIELVELARDNVAVHRRTLEDVLRRVGGGEASIADAQQAEERLRNAERILVDTEVAFEDARIDFQRLVGQPAGQLFMPATVVAALPPDVDSAVEMALVDNPTIQLGLADLDVSYAEFRASEAPFYPSLSIESSASVGEDLDGAEGREERFNVQLVARYNLFRGFIDSANRQEQVARIGESRERVATFARDVEELVRSTWNSLEGAARNIEILQQQVVAAEQVRNSYREQFDIGARTLLDVLDSENELFLARSDLVSFRFAEEFGRYRVLAAGGRLLPTLGVQAPEEGRANARERVGGVLAPHVSDLAIQDDF